MSDEWIEWKGGECPVPHETVVDVKFRGGAFHDKLPAACWCWKRYGDRADIIAYRLHKEPTP